MQALAVVAVVLGAVMLVGVAVTLIVARRGPAGFSSWNRRGTIPLAAAGLALGIIARTGSGQTSATHDTMFAVTTVLLSGALLCALAGATAATRRSPDRDQA